MSEKETYEEKPSFEWSREGEFDLLKTIIAFANCQGGKILLRSVAGDTKRLDSARLDDFANKYVSPRIGGIVSTEGQDGSWTIVIAKSSFAPHVIAQEASFQKGKRIKSAFYPGQIYVRHSSKSEPARGEDIQTLIREGVSSWLSSLGAAVAAMGISGQDDGEGIPIRLVEGGPSLALSLASGHPHIASEIGEPVGKTGSWIGKWINQVGLRSDRRYVAKIPGGKTEFYRFSDLAKATVQEVLDKNPECNPYSCDKQGCRCIKLLQGEG
jgi:hypothetical protein